MPEPTDHEQTESSPISDDEAVRVMDEHEEAESETDRAFLERLKRLGSDWRYSDELIGIVIRNCYPRNYGDA